MYFDAKENKNKKQQIKETQQNDFLLIKKMFVRLFLFLCLTLFAADKQHWHTKEKQVKKINGCHLYQPEFVWCPHKNRAERASAQKHWSPLDSNWMSSTRTSGHLGREKKVTTVSDSSTFPHEAPPTLFTNYPFLGVFIQMRSNVTNHREDVAAGCHI